MGVEQRRKRMKLEKNFLKIIKNAAREKTHAYDTTATVTRVEKGTAWVHIDGGVPETPAELTIAAKVGDQVKVRVSGGRAYLLGNSTAPPTDDQAANVAAQIASQAAFNAQTAEQTAADTREKTKNAITSMVTFYKLAAGIPATPSDSTWQRDGWSSTEPVWDADSSDKLYYSIRSQTASGTVSWSTPAELASYASLTIAQNAIMAEVTDSFVEQGTSGITSLGSSLVQTSSGLDIYSTVNGSKQATHTHIDGDSFDVVKDGKVIASFGATTTLGNSERTDWPGIYDSFLELTDSYLKIKPRSSYYDPWCTGLTNNSIFGIFKTAEYDPTYSMNDTFAEFEVGEHGLTYGDQSSNTFFKIGIYTYQGEGPSSYEYESCLWLGNTRITASELAALKALIS